MGKASSAGSPEGAPLRTADGGRLARRTADGPQGRSLTDFLPLSPAERKLHAACALGEPAQIWTARPEARSDATLVRADFLRFICLGGDRDARVHERGPCLKGAYVEGLFDLRGCNVMRPLFFELCTFADGIDAEFADLRGLELERCWLKHLNGRLLRCSGNVFIRHGAVEGGVVDLRRSTIEGALSFRGSHFSNQGEKTINCSHANIKGGVYCNDGFRSDGLIHFYKCTIGGDVTFAGGIFCQSISRVVAISLEGSTVGSALYYRNVVSCEGRVNFTALHVSVLIDDFESWRLTEPVLDGMTYDRLGAGQADAAERIKWLASQRTEHVGESFRPQPWEHLAKVLREMGHTEGARRIAIGKQHALRKAGQIGQRPTTNVGYRRGWLNVGLNAASRTLHWAYGVLAGFGYRPLKTVGWMVFVWLVSGLAYTAAEKDGLFGPTNPRIYADSAYGGCGDGGEPGKQRWTHCNVLPPEHTRLDPLIYSLDVILPLVDLKQENEWAPIVHSADGSELLGGHALRFLMWFEILFGWITSLLLVSAVGRLVQKD